MPERHYMVVDGRRDHSFRIPRPLLSARVGSPDVCTGCHEDNTAQWAAGEIEQGLSAARIDRLIDVGVQCLHPLQAVALDRQQPAIVRASALNRLSGGIKEAEWVQVAALLDDGSPLVRSEAVGFLVAAPGARRATWLGPLLKDPVRSVRIEVAKAMLNVMPDELPEDTLPALRAAMAELQKSLIAKADFPESQMVMGGVALTLRNWPAALDAFQRAVEMDPQLTQAWTMLAKIQAALGERDAVYETLEKAIASNPGDETLKQALVELGPR